MSEEQEDEFETVPVPCETAYISDGDFVVFDWAEFCEAFDCFGMMLQDGNIFLLDRETRDFKNLKTYKRSKLKVVKGES